MSHGYGAVKEVYLAEVARVIAGAGMARLVYDHRALGASDVVVR